MNVRDRLHMQQAALEKRGVKDVKFFFMLGTETSASNLAADVAEVLEAVHDGKAVEIGSFATLNAA